jgi:hypothetical protein
MRGSEAPLAPVPCRCALSILYSPSQRLWRFLYRSSISSSFNRMLGAGGIAAWRWCWGWPKAGLSCRSVSQARGLLSIWVTFYSPCAGHAPRQAPYITAESGLATSCDRALSSFTFVSTLVCLSFFWPYLLTCSTGLAREIVFSQGCFIPVGPSAGTAATATHCALQR